MHLMYQLSSFRFLFIFILFILFFSFIFIMAYFVAVMLGLFFFSVVFLTWFFIFMPCSFSLPLFCFFFCPMDFLKFIYIFIYFITWRLITSQYCSGFCHTLTRIRHGFTCIPHPDPPSHLPLHPIPLDLPSAPGLSTCLRG